MERKLIAVAVSSALALPMAAQAVEFAASGQLNRAIISVDGGANDGSLQHVDANASQSRFRFTGSGELDSGMTAGVQLEYGLTANVRHANAYLSSEAGKLTVGHGSRATDGMAHAYLGGPSWLGGATPWCAFHSVATNPACPTNDGGRGPMLRYDTPAIGPAGISISAADDDYWDVKLTISGSMGDAGYDLRLGHIGEHDADVVVVPLSVTAVRAGDLRAALETAEESVAEHFMAPDFSLQDAYGEAIDDKGLASGGADRLVYKHQAKKATTPRAGDITTASAAVNFGQGTSVALTWSQDSLADHEYQYIKLDHSYGDGSIGVYYKAGETDGGTRGSYAGIAVGHSLGAGATAYAGYRQMSQDATADIDLLVAGLLVSFN